MKKKLITAIIIIVSILPSLLLVNSSYAQEDTTSEDDSKLILYVLNTCPYCEELLLELEEENLLEYVIIKESSQDPNRNELLEVANTCSTRAAVPLLFDGERCYQGRYSARDKIFEDAGVTVSVYEVDPNESYTSGLDEDPSPPPLEEEDLLARDNEDINRELPDRTEEESETSESTNLGERIDQTTQKASLPDVPPLTIIASLLAPVVLISIGYVIITKMKV